MFPIKNKEMWSLYKKATASFWLAEEISLRDDRAGFLKLEPNEQRFVEHVLAFFAASDGVVTENLATHFLGEVQCPAARAFYGFQIAIETVHGETYSLMIDTLVQEEKRKTELLTAVENMDCVKQKASWALRWMDSRRSFAHRLMAFACVEGIHFSAAFASVFWLRFRKRQLPGLFAANNFIMRDEGLHTEAACLLYTQLKKRLTDSEAHAIVGSAVAVEEVFVRESLPVSLIGINADKMMVHVKMCADRLLEAAGHPALYGITQGPFPWMNDQAVTTCYSNFFEARSNSGYVKPGAGATVEQNSFSIAAAF
tara:strand:+ start:24 stop:959 length:936 start_codon:yes stop_codon:yes gene_type:complete